MLKSTGTGLIIKSLIPAPIRYWVLIPGNNAPENRMSTPSSMTLLQTLVWIGLKCAKKLVIAWFIAVRRFDHFWGPPKKVKNQHHHREMLGKMIFKVGASGSFFSIKLIIKPIFSKYVIPLANFLNFWPAQGSIRKPKEVQRSPREV